MSRSSRSSKVLDGLIDRREFFQTVGGGLAVFALAAIGDELALGQPPAVGRRRGGGSRDDGSTRSIAAWIHVGEDGKVTVSTGKAEVGQNIRTSLSQVVAEELRVALVSITLVMGDTKLTPYDAGTFGSRTTPDMAPRLRAAAAAARQVLLTEAARRWNTEAAQLQISDGKIIRGGGGEAKDVLTYGELTKGRKLTEVIDDRAPITPPRDWQVAGTSVLKVNGHAFVTGGHKYTSDVQVPGMVRGKVLRSPTLGGTLKQLDSSGLDSLKDVQLVRDGGFVGVVAPREFLADRALAALKADWNPGPPISSKTLFEDLKARGSETRARAEASESRGLRRQGSVAEGMKQADVKLEQTYTIAYIAHASLEPRAAVARWEEDGSLTVWTGTQRPFGVRGELAAAFNLAENQVRVIVPDTGSGYGGKHSGEAAVEAARLARAVKKPVKLVWTREEEFTWAYFRPAGVIEITAGATQDGKLTAWEHHNINSGPSGIGTPYEVANQFAAFHPVSAPLRQGSYRALASTANTFAREVHMDELAAALKLDPLEFRLKNLIDPRARAVLQAAAKAFGWGGRPGKEQGFGLALGFEKGSYVATCAEVVISRPRGQVQVVRAVSAFDCGAVLNPEHLKNQIEGMILMGLGGALYESIEYEGGALTNARFSSYRVPRFRDAPRIEVVLLDQRDRPSVGAGETPIVGIGPAIGNALFQADGQRRRSLPLLRDGTVS